MGFRGLSTAIVGFIGVFGSISAAWACSGLPCGPGYLLPGPDGQVPANAPALLWMPSKDDFAERPSLDPSVTGPDGQPVDFTIVGGPATGPWQVRLNPPLQMGLHVFRSESRCPVGPSEDQEFSFRVTPEAPRPTSLGAMRVARAFEGEIRLGTSGGSCDTAIVADTVDVEVDLAPEAEPWKDVLLLETLVDGEPWRPRGSIVQRVPAGASWVGRMRDRVYAVCSVPGAEPTERGVDEGLHTIEMVARLPGDEAFVIRSEPLSVMFECGSDPDPTPDPDVDDPDVDGPDGGELAGAEAGCRCVARPAAGSAGAIGLGLLLFGYIFRPASRRR